MELGLARHFGATQAARHMPIIIFFFAHKTQIFLFCHQTSCCCVWPSATSEQNKGKNKKGKTNKQH